ncbi:MAG: enoyl-CoA hydratase/isomerase family protein [Pseudomonadota bacterium]|nr:enoyl-CoA hydratase [Pseudomonadales bacterium]MDY6921889.1 enoyl-CoA hydratase/isomerase family protein [Pseudomonadota bacterium]
MSETISVQVERKVALLSFSNPPYNFATVALLRGLAEALEQLDADSSVQAVCLQAEGKVFCAGADLVSENGFGASSEDPLREFYDQVQRLFQTRKPIVAAVQGAAIGAGLGLALAADFRVASPQARFAANFVKLGFHPGFGLTHTLPRVIGPQHAAEMFLTGDRYRAGDVLPWGLIDRLCETDELLPCARQLAEAIAINGPLGLAATRVTLRGDLAEQVRRALAAEHAQQRRLQTTEDFAEGVRAVSERRPGNFKGC